MGKKRVKGEGAIYDERKKQRAAWITDTAWNAIGKAAKARGISCSELIEEYGRQLGETGVQARSPS